MAFQQDYNLSKQLSHPLFEKVSISLMAIAWGIFALSAKNYSSSSWYPWLISSRISSSIIGLLLLAFITKKNNSHKNLSAVYLTFSLMIQSTHGFLEGSSSIEFHNFTGIIFVLASLSFNGPFRRWLLYYLPTQLFIIGFPLFYKEDSFFSSLSTFVDHFSLIVSGLLIGGASAYLTSSRYTYMKKYLEEKEEKYLSAKQVYHDLKSPLSFIRGALVNGNLESTQTKQIIEMSLLRIESIAEKNYSKSKKYDYDLFQMLHFLKLEKQFLYSDVHLSLSFNIPELLKNKIPTLEISDLMTAISNIIDNAVEATESKGIISVDVKTDFDDLNIYIKDNGTGVPAKIADKIYDQNFTFDKKGGSGLGLYQAKRAIESYSGTLQLVENSSYGATFHIYIPNILQTSDHKEASANDLLAHSSSEAIKPSHDIILIDDDKFIRINWSMHFNALGINFTSFSSISDFLVNSGTFSKEARVFVDSSLGNGEIGEIHSRKIYEQGFKNIYLATGHSRDAIEKPFWIIDILSKTPQHALRL